MPIWSYSETQPPDIVKSYGYREVESCFYCNEPLAHLAGPNYSGSYLGADLRGLPERRPKRLQVCPLCGWWVVTAREGYAYGSYEGALQIYRACGALLNLDLKDLSVPIEQLRAYLLARYEDRFHVHPKKYEDIVAGVFSDFGYQVRVTAYSGDDGIDAFVFDGEAGNTVGVQVKRYAGKIDAEQIRSFAGALLLHGLTKGVFVTTSSFQPGAVASAERFEGRNVRIQLVDAEQFYEKLRLAQRAPFSSAEDTSAPFHRFWAGGEDPTLIYSHAW